MALWIVVLLTFLTHIGYAGSRVVVTLFAVDQGATPFMVGSVVSLYAMIPMVLALPAGRLIDQLGFKIPIVFGISGIGLALLLPAVWPSLTVLYFTASLLGVSFMAFQIATQTLAGAMSKPSERARNFSIVSLGFASANFAGPLLSGFLIDQIGYVRTFLALTLPLLPAIALTLFGSSWLPQPRGESAPAGRAASDLLRIQPLRNALIASAIVSSAWDLYQFFMPIYGRAQGLSATAIGTVMSAFAISTVLVRMLMPVALRHAGAAQLLTYAMFVACAAYGLFPLFHVAWPLAAVSFLLGIGCGCGQPLSLTLLYDASPIGRAAETTGMRVTANQIMHFVIPLLFGALGSAAGLAAVFITNAGFLALGGYASQRSHAAR